MPARRSLRLEVSGSDKNEKSQIMAAHDPSSYSPLTGTRRMSLSTISKRKRRAAPADREERRADDIDHGKSAEPEKSSRGQSPTEENSELLELFSRVERSLGAFLKMRRGLKNLQALEGAGELGNVIGTLHPTLDLRTEMQKAKVLICEVRKKKAQQSTV